MVEGFTEMAVQEVKRAFEYRISSFHVVSVSLREARLYCEDVFFDGFIRFCDLLTSVSLPAIARVPNGAMGACFVKAAVALFTKGRRGCGLLSHHSALLPQEARGSTGLNTLSGC